MYLLWLLIWHSLSLPALSIWILSFQKFRWEVLTVKYAPRKVYIKKDDGYVELSPQAIRPKLYGQTVYPCAGLSAWSRAETVCRIFTRRKNGGVMILSIEMWVWLWYSVKGTNRNSDKTLFIAFNNCYILSSKSPQTLENAKFIASEFALMLSLVLYPFPSCYEPS